MRKVMVAGTEVTDPRPAGNLPTGLRVGAGMERRHTNTHDGGSRGTEAESRPTGESADEPDTKTPIRITKLRLAILSDGRKQKDIAAAAGMQMSRLSEYVVGKRDIIPRHLIQLSRVLRVNPEDLRGSVDNVDL